MAGAVTIRRAVEADVAVLRELLAALCDEIGYGAAFCTEAAALRRHGFGPHPLFRALVAERADHTVGMALYFPEFSTLRGLPGVYLQDLYLRRDARGSGLGRRLIGAVIRDAADWQAVYLRLTTHKSNEDALAFYEWLGFRNDPLERTLMVDGKQLAGLGEIA